MILVDVNLLVYATVIGSAHHPAARAWWENQLRSTNPVGVGWVSILGFLRIATNPRAVIRPLPLQQALELVDSWLTNPCVRLLEPTSGHWPALRRFLALRGSGGNATTDAHLAALAVEHDCELVSCDADFGNLPGLRWRNPLVSGSAALS